MNRPPLPSSAHAFYSRAKAALIALSLALAILAYPLTSQAAYNIWKVADSQTRIPGYFSGQHYFTELGFPAMDGSDVVWYGLGTQSNVYGIFIHDGTTHNSSSLHIISTSLTYVPGESVQFSGYGNMTSVNDRWVTFLGKANVASMANGLGVYQAFYSGVSVPIVNQLANLTTSGIDAGSDISNPEGASFDTAAFLATFRGGDGNMKNGVFVKYGGNVTKIADSDTNMPGSETPFSSFDRRPSMEGKTVFFYGQNAQNQKGLYYSSYPFSSITAVVNPGDKAPGSNYEFVDFQSLSLGDNRMAFYAQTGNGRGIYTADFSGRMAKVVDQSDFHLILPFVSTKRGDLAYVAGPGYPVLNIQVKGNRLDVIDSLTSLGGKGVNFIRMGTQGFNGYSASFWVYLDDHSHAIYRADRMLSTGFHQNEPLTLAITEEEMRAGLPSAWNLALVGDDLGLARPLWLAPEYASSYLCRISGSAVLSINTPEEVDPENLYDIVVFDPESGEMLGEPVQVPGGERLDFRELGHDEGVRSFAIRGATLDPDYRGQMPLGMIFSEEGPRPGVSVSRCADEIEKCGER